MLGDGDQPLGCDVLGCRRMSETAVLLLARERLVIIDERAAAPDRITYAAKVLSIPLAWWERGGYNPAVGARMVPDLEKVRRFALGVALVHLALAFAGVQLDASRQITPLGIPLKIGTPHLFAYVLLAASLYASLRFLFYAYFAVESPTALRRHVFEFLAAEELKVGETVQYHTNSPANARRLERFIESAVPGGRASADEAPTPSAPQRWEVTYFIPKYARYLGRVQDLDYSAPIWTNVLAMAAGLWALWDAG